MSTVRPRTFNLSAHDIFLFDATDPAMPICSRSLGALRLVPDSPDVRAHLPVWKVHGVSVPVVYPPSSRALDRSAIDPALWASLTRIDAIVVEPEVGSFLAAHPDACEAKVFVWVEGIGVPTQPQTPMLQLYKE